jgi:hypothetical protein
VVADSFSSCEILAANAPAVCPDLAALTTDADCDAWAASEGRLLGLGQDAILQMAPQMDGAVTFQDYCTAAGSPPKATNAICNSVPADAAMQACTVYASPATAVRVICLDLGFSDGTCADVQAGLPAEVSTCDILLASWTDLCQGLADANTDPTCQQWGPTAHVSGTVDAAGFNGAVAALEADVLGLLQSG